MALIAISGYAKSGKDTVGKIIQWLNCYNVGKVELTDVINSNEHDWWLSDQSGWDVKKFAGKLKQIASILTGIPTTMFEDQHFKNKELPKRWSKNGLPMTVRDLLQLLGTDAIRNGLHHNAWVNALMADYADGAPVGRDSEGTPVYGYPNWIITDCRFPNEAYAIKENGGIIVRVNRPGTKPVNDHPSEIALDGWDFNYTINNDGDFNHLTDQIKTILIKEKLYRNARYNYV